MSVPQAGLSGGLVMRFQAEAIIEDVKEGLRLVAVT
jgi:hypothetical protein